MLLYLQKHGELHMGPCTTISLAGDSVANDVNLKSLMIHYRGELLGSILCPGTNLIAEHGELHMGPCIVSEG